MANNLDKEEWLEWCKNPVTERFIKDIQDKVNSETWALVEEAGKNQPADAKSSGKIIAWGEVLNWRPEEFNSTDHIEFRDGGDDSDAD